MGSKKEKSALTEGVFYILISLYKPLHGYGIMKFVSEISNDRVNLGPGTLYGALNTLLEKKWISVVSNETDKRKKEYIITDEGKEVVEGELIRLKELLENGNRIVKGEYGC